MALAFCFLALNSSVPRRSGFTIANLLILGQPVRKSSLPRRLKVLQAKSELEQHTQKMGRRITLNLGDFTPEEAIWCRARVTATRIMLPCLDPMLRSLIIAMAAKEDDPSDSPKEIIISLQDVPKGDLELAENFLGQLANQAKLEEQERPSLLLSDIVSEVSAELTLRTQCPATK